MHHFAFSHFLSRSFCIYILHDDMQDKPCGIHSPTKRPHSLFTKLTNQPNENEKKKQNQRVKIYFTLYLYKYQLPNGCHKFYDFVFILILFVCIFSLLHNHTPSRIVFPFLFHFTVFFPHFYHSALTRIYFFALKHFPPFFQQHFILLWVFKRTRLHLFEAIGFGHAFVLRFATVPHWTNDL